MKILFYGVGPLGSLFAVRLAEAGHDVVVLARGQRLEDIREHGIVIINDQTEEREVAHVEVVESLEPEDVYDLIMVVMRKNQAVEILPNLAANKATPTVLFMMNNAGGQQELVDALGRQRVMIGFPLAGGRREGHAMRMIPADECNQWELPVGEVDGRITARTRQVADVLESMRGYTVDIRTDMDAWLKYHVALVGPLAASIYAADTDIERLSGTRDALVLGVRGIKEAMRGLRQAGVPPTPAGGRVLEWMPEPLLVALVSKVASIDYLRVSLEGHPRDARDEMRHMLDELMAFLKHSGAETPNLDLLYPYLDPNVVSMPEGSSAISMNWRGVWMPALGAAALLGGLLYWRQQTNA